MTITIPVTVVTFFQAGFLGAGISYVLAFIAGLIGTRKFGPIPKAMPIGVYVVVGGTFGSVCADIVTIIVLCFHSQLSDIVTYTMVTAAVASIAASIYIKRTI